MKLIIVGGVAGGASAAARARRLNEEADIILFERGEYISFANCGLPYHLGKTIQKKEDLIVISPEKFKARTNVDVRTRQEVISINPQKKSVTVKKHQDGEVYEESYDKLILSPGSTPIRPPIPGIDDPDVFVLWTIPDMDRIKARVDRGVKEAVIVGAGFIGLEVAENFQKLGIKTSIVELLPQVMPNLDHEMSWPIAECLVRNCVKVFLNNGVTKISRKESKLIVTLKDGAEITTDMVIMSVGIRPNSELARQAGLKVSDRGGIVVNDKLQTSEPDIYAVGDAIQTYDLVRGVPAQVPLAGPANRQGKIAAENALGGNAIYKGTMGTAVCKIFELTSASVGVNEKALKQSGAEYEKIYIYPFSHASYYPGAKSLCMKLIFNKTGNVLGAQIIGEDGADKRIDVIATAIRGNMTVYDLCELDLSYAPPYNSAKDPVNFAGYVASNVLKGHSKIVHGDQIPSDAFLLDVQEEEEVKVASIPGAYNIPLGKLRSRISELPKDKLIVTYCKVGLRGYIAEKIIRQKGFNVKNLSGGISIWKAFNPQPLDTIPVLTSGTKSSEICCPAPGNAVELNVCGMQCPGPIISVKQEIDKMKQGEILHVTASDTGFLKDIPAWCNSTGNELIRAERTDKGIEALICKGTPSSAAKPSQEESTHTNKRSTIVVFSNELDKVMAGFIMATGFAALGHEVSMFFTFWGLNVLRKDNPPKVKKDVKSRMFAKMMPAGPEKLKLSKMNFGGMGTKMMKDVMAQKHVDSLPTLMSQARNMGIKFLACEMAMNVMGIQQSELIDGVEIVGVANFASLAEKSGTTMFI